ncbi:MAG: hexitol phosphatase HxpB [Ignavibacteria bacterium]
MIKAVIFDMDGVILDSEPFWKEAEIRIFNFLGVPLTGEMCETTTGMRLVDVTKLWHEKYSWDITKYPYEKVNRDIVDSLIELIKQKGELNTGVTELLEMLNSKGLPMAIASSSDMKIIDAVLDKFGLRNYFKVIHSAEFEDYGKPHPAIYITTAKKLGVEPSECLAIEDSFNGVVAAIAARMKTAAYPEKTNFYNPKFAIADIKFRTLKDFTEEEFRLLDK